MGYPAYVEIGHGRLAPALLAVAYTIDEEFPSKISASSRNTESNGSSSMAFVCALWLDGRASQRLAVSQWYG